MGRSFSVDFATDADDLGLRRLLRETPMPGPIRISLEREPGFFAAARAEGGRHFTICARDADTGEVFAMGSRTVRRLFVNGEPRPVGYLSQLRIAHGYRHLSRELLRRGFALLRETRAADEAPFDITTIVAGNEIARRLLEAGLSRLPRYTQVEKVLTMFLPAASLRGLRADADPSIIDVTHASRYQFSVVEPLPAVWDQRDFKQIVVRGYSPWLRRFRWLFRLPPVGTVLPVAYATRWPISEGTSCRWVALGLAARHPSAEVIQRRYRPRVYESTLYAVHDTGTTVKLDGRLAHVEVALL